MRTFQKKYVELGVELGVLSLVFFSTTFNSFIKSLSNIFMGGRSSVKVYILVIILILIRRLYSTRIKIKASVLKWHAILCISLFTAGLLQYLIFYRQTFGSFAFGRMMFVDVFVPPNAVSATLLQHAHNSKSGIGVLIEKLFGSSVFTVFDAGWPFAAFLPTPIIVVQVIAFVVFIGISFLLLLQQTKALGFKAFALFGLVLCVLVKNTMDGGALNSEAWLYAIPIYLSFLFMLTGVRSLTQVTCAFVSITAFFWTTYYFLFGGTDWMADTLLMFLASIVLVSSLELFSFSFIKQKFWPKTAFQLMALVALVAVMLNPFFSESPFFRKQQFQIAPDTSLHEGERIEFFTYNFEAVAQLKAESFLDIEEQSIIHQFGYFKAKMQKKMTYHELSNRLGVNPNLFPIETNQLCDAPFKRYSHRVFNNRLPIQSTCYIRTADGLNTIDSKVVGHFSLKTDPLGAEKTIHGDKFFLANLEFAGPACTPNSLAAFLNMMFLSGISEAICFIRQLSPYEIEQVKRD